MRTIQIETVGRDGKGGTLARVEEEQDDTRSAIKTNQATIQALQISNRELVLKLSIVVAVIVSAVTIAVNKLL